MLGIKERTEILKTIRKLVAEKLFHPWWSIEQIEDKAATLEDIGRDLLDLPDNEFENRLNSWLAGFGLSHTGFFHVSGLQVPPQFAIGAELRLFQNGTGQAWYVQNVMPGGAAEGAGMCLGDAVLAMNGQALTPSKEPKFQLGRKHELLVQPPDGNAARTVTISLEKPTAKDRPPMLMPKPLSDQILDGNIGLIKIATFPGTVGFDFARDFDRIIAKFKAAVVDRLILDLRGNPGGGLGSLRVMSYLVPDRRPAGYSLTRRGRTLGLNINSVTAIERIPAKKIGLWMVALRFGLLHRDRSLGLWTENLGPQPFHGKTVLIVDEFTRSAAEMIAAFAAKTESAVLVGSKTPGQVLGAANFKLPADYRLRIPITAWYLWDDRIIEGRGIQPDREVSASLEDLRSGKDLQREAAIVDARGVGALRTAAP